MSMDFSEFRRLMGADPWNQDSETLSARNSAPEFEQAATDAETFERKLQAAVNVAVPVDLLTGIQAISRQPARQRNWMPFAMAASLLIAIGAVGVVWKQSQHQTVIETYLANHYGQDGAELLAKATDVVPAQQIRAIMTSLNASAGSQLADNMRYIKFCPTPEGRGAHMVVSTDLGPVTIIFMPEMQVTDGALLEFDQMRAYLVNLDHGSAAIIGTLSQPIESLQAVVRSSLRTGLIGT